MCKEAYLASVDSGVQYKTMHRLMSYMYNIVYLCSTPVYIMYASTLTMQSCVYLPDIIDYVLDVLASFLVFLRCFKTN